MGRVILFLLKILGHSFSILPRRMQLALGAGLGWVLKKLNYRRKVVLQNLSIIYEHESEAWRQKVFDQSYTHIGNLFLEILLLFGGLKKFVERYADLEGHENFKAAQRQGKGVIFLSSHVGNWEIMAAVGGLNAMDLMLVTKHLKPQWLHEAIEQGRLTCNVTGAYEPKTLKSVLAHFKKKATVGFVLDQYVGPPVGVRVPLCGVPVGTALVVATMAKRTGAPVLPVVNYRTPEGRWIVSIQEPLAWKNHDDPNYELAMNTANYSSVVEKFILDHPDQWLWIHRRFKGDLSPLREGEWQGGRARK